MLRTACSLLLAALCAATAAEPPKPTGALSLLRQLDEGFVAVFEKVAPCVVVIEATKRKEAGDAELEFLSGAKDSRDDPAERAWTLPSRSEGSGFIIRHDGYILTNLHVVAEAEKITVRLRDGRSFPGRKVGEDDKTDIAILRIDARDLPAAEIGDSDAVRVGQLVCAIGAPFNQHFSFSVGWVSGKGRTNLLGPTAADILYEDYLQTDTFINPGNSGGPLFDVDGRVIGMNTLINGIGRGLAFAIPSAMFQEVAQQLIAHGRIERARLGIRMDSLSERPAVREHAGGLDRGAVVETIEPDSPAWGKLQAADVIVDMDGVKIGVPLDVQKEMLKKKVGATVQLTVWRAGKVVNVSVATSEQPSKLTKASNVRPGKLGVETKAESLGLHLRDARPSGAVVVAVAPDSPAQRATVLSRDIITAVAGHPVNDAAAAAAAIGDHLRAKPGKGVILNVERHGRRTFVELTPE